MFIDDSGDAGFKFGQGSSDHLVIACCVFRTAEAAESAAEQIRTYRSDLGWHPGQEFKFTKAQDEIRFEFLKRAAKMDFYIRVLVVEKRTLELGAQHSGKVSFLLFAIMQALAGSSEVLELANIKIDGKSSRLYSADSARYLKWQLNGGNQKLISSVKFVDSQGDQLIQLADMIAGAVRRTLVSDRVKDFKYEEIVSVLESKADSLVWKLEER